LTATVNPGIAGTPPASPMFWEDLDSHGHSVQFYEDDSYLLDGLSRFIGSALGSGDAGIVIATEEHRTGLAKRLKARGLDTSVAGAQGRYVSFDAAETLAQFMRDGQPDASRFTQVLGNLITRAAAAASGAHPRVAAFGEMVALLWAEGNPAAAIRVEQLWNELAETHTFSLHCAYPMRFFAREGDSEPIELVCAEHSRVLPTESYTSLVTENERMRTIALLQQKAQALEAEIEERKAIEQELEHREAELRDAVASRDEFLSVAAHELRTPLTGLRLVAQLLVREKERNRELTANQLQSALSALDSQTEKLNQLVARLLDRAQIEAGKLRIQPTPTDLVSLVSSVLDERYQGDRNRFVFNAPDHIEAVVDPIRFEQVISNLLANAVKFSPPGSAVMIDLSHNSGGGIRLAVTDHGVGIPADQREAVFERFHQAHSDPHRVGMGLGLYITREIVRLHGGTVCVEEPEHPGTRIVVTLPPSGCVSAAA